MNIVHSIIVQLIKLKAIFISCKSLLSIVATFPIVEKWSLRIIFKIFSQKLEK